MADIKEEIREKFGDIETIPARKEDFKPDKFVATNYPKPVKRKFLIYENFGLGVEENYYWIKDALTDAGFTEIEKITDTFTAAEQSAFFGSAQQRLSIQQDKVASYLATIGQMVRQMFQVVRDIKLLEEREVLYDLAKKGDDGAEKALKGTWIDFVDNGPGGVKASSVYGLASQIGYTTLPDLFFASPANLQQKDVSNYVQKELKEFNEKVKTALVRKLEQYIAWRDSTSKEITGKKKFTISYLRQHYNSIKLYIDWVKPYLRNIKRLTMDPQAQLSANIVGAFEGAVTEIEILAKKPGNPHSCVLASFLFRTRPVMQTGADYQRGPAHIGRMEMTLRAYAWSDDDIANYKKLKMQEDFEMIKSIDASLEESMNYLGEDIRKYLEEKGEKFGKENEVEVLAKSLYDAHVALTLEAAREKAKEMTEKKKKEKQKRESVLEPFIAMFTGVAEIPKMFIPGKNDAKEERAKAEKMKKDKKDKAKDAAKSVAGLYMGYKKSRRFVTP